MILHQIAPFQDGFHQFKAAGGSIAHRHSYRAIQFDNWGRFNAQQKGIQRNNLAPVGGAGRGCLGVNCGNGGLQRKRTQTPRCKSALHQRQPSRDLLMVPQGTILILKQDQIAFGRRSRRSARRP